MTPTRIFIRQMMILALAFVGVFAIWAVDENPMARRIAIGLGCVLLAYIYAQVTQPRGQD